MGRVGWVRLRIGGGVKFVMGVMVEFGWPKFGVTLTQTMAVELVILSVTVNSKQ